MEIKTEVMNDMQELSPDAKKKLAQTLADNFAKWDDDRASQITTAKEIMQEVYLQQPSLNKNGQEWKSDVKLNAQYNIKKALKSMLWREVYPNADSMFGVRGTNEQTEQTAKPQKAAIVDSFNKMNIGKQYDLAVDSLLDVGEAIAKVDWVSKKKIVKRQNKSVGWMFNNLVSMATGAGTMEVPFTDIEIPLYENARVEAISPFMFVFDHSKFKLFNEESWDSCIKIYKRFDTLENIKANKVYEIAQEWLDELKQPKDNKTTENKELVDMRDEHEFGDMYSVMFAHGDFKVNGKIYKNYVAEVLAGKYLIRFEKNPMQINPFVYCALEYDPYTKRGISLLKSTINMCREEERLTNVAFDVQKLTANPVLLAPKGVFEDIADKNGNVVYEPGKVLEYEVGITNQLPIPVQMNANGISDLLGLLNQKIADSSSVSNVMYGNIESEKRTATELSLADKGSTSQISKILDVFYQDFTIPIVKAVAELLATFKDGVDFVYAQEKGKNLEYRITNEIRQAQYNYYYEDRNALNDYKTRVELLYKVCQGAFQLPQLASQLDEKEIFTMVVETLNFDNVERLFKPATPATQFGEQLAQIPENMQGQVVQALQGQLQQMMQQYQAQQEQANMQAQVQRQVQMQQMRDNVKAQMEAESLGVM